MSQEFLEREFLDNTVEAYLWFLGAITILLLLNRYISKVLSFLLYRLFGHFTGKENAQPFVDLLRKPIAFLVFTIVLSIALGTLEFPDAWDLTFYDIHLKRLFKVIMQLLVVAAGIWMVLRIVDFFSLLLYQRAERTESKMDDQLVPFIKDFMKVFVVIISIFFILSSVFHMNISSLIAGLGIGGLAVALAAKESLENLFGSFAIFLDKPFTVGDFVQVGEVIGTIEKVGFRSTRIRTLERTFVTVPNRKIVDSITDNLTLRTFRRVRFMVGVTYDTSIEQIKAIVADIQQFLDEHPGTNDEGIVGFHEFGDSSLSILVQYYPPNMPWAEYVKLREEINFKIMEIVKKHGSDFAFPTRTVHMHNEDLTEKTQTQNK